MSACIRNRTLDTSCAAVGQLSLRLWVTAVVVMCAADCGGCTTALPGGPGADLSPANIQLSQRRQ